MKLLNIVLLLCFSFLSYGQTPDFSSGKNLIKTALSGLASGNNDTYLQTVYNKSAFLFRATKGRLLSEQDKTKNEEMINQAYEEYLKEQKARFASFQTKIKEFTIDWSNTKIDSIVIKQDDDDMKETFSGTVYFRKDDNSAFFKANFLGLMKFEDRFYFESIYVPHRYIGPKNRLLTAKIKQQYIDTCVKDANYKISFTKSTVLTAFFGDCIPCHCEKQYFSETEQEDGILRVKNAIKRGVPKLTGRK